MMVFVLDDDGKELGCWRMEKEGMGKIVLEFEIPHEMMEEPNYWLGYHMSVSTEQSWKVDRDLSIKAEDREYAKAVNRMGNKVEEIPDGNWI